MVMELNSIPSYLAGYHVDQLYSKWFCMHKGFRFLRDIFRGEFLHVFSYVMDSSKMSSKSSSLSNPNWFVIEYGFGRLYEYKFMHILSNLFNFMLLDQLSQIFLTPSGQFRTLVISDKQAVHQDVDFRKSFFNSIFNIFFSSWIRSNFIDSSRFGWDFNVCVLIPSFPIVIYLNFSLPILVSWAFVSIYSSNKYNNPSMSNSSSVPEIAFII